METRTIDTKFAWLCSGVIAMVLANVALADQAGPGDFLWTFEDAGTNDFVTSLHNNATLSLLSFAPPQQAYFTNASPPAFMGNFDLHGRADTVYNPGQLTNQYSQMTLMFYYYDNVDSPTVDTAHRQSQSSVGAPGCMSVQLIGGYPRFDFIDALGNYNYRYADYTVSSGQWTQVAMTFSNGVLQWYKNGVARNSFDFTGGGANPVLGVIPSADSVAMWRFTSGGNTNLIDELAIYDQVLSQSDISFIAQNGLQAFDQVPEPTSLTLIALTVATLGLSVRSRGRMRRS